MSIFASNEMPSNRPNKSRCNFISCVFPAIVTFFWFDAAGKIQHVITFYHVLLKIFFIFITNVASVKNFALSILSHRKHLHSIIIVPAHRTGEIVDYAPRE